MRKMGKLFGYARLSSQNQEGQLHVDALKKLGGEGIGFRSLCDGTIDTATTSGKLIFNIFSSLS